MSELNIQDALDHLGGSVSLYRTLVQGFCEKYNSVDTLIEQALDNGDIEEARRYAHSMKGLSGNLGAITLQERAKDLEMVLKDQIAKESVSNHNSDEILRLKQRFSAELEITLKFLKCILKMENEEINELKSVDDIKCITDDGEQCIKGMVRTLVGDEILLKLNQLIGALGSYNYETICGVLTGINEEAIEGIDKSKWRKVKSHIVNYEYDLAKQALIEGIENEG